MNIANFILYTLYIIYNIYIYVIIYIYIYIYIYMYVYKIQIYIPIFYVTRTTQNRNDSINSILEHGRVVDNNFCVVFPTSR